MNPTEPAKSEPAKSVPPPRVARQNERAGDGLKRFKLRGDVPGLGLPAKYVLAADASAAEAFYRERFGVPAGEHVELTELPD